MGLVGRRIWEAAKNWPLMAVLFLPIAFSLPTLFVWARPEAANDPMIHDKAGVSEPVLLLRPRRAVCFVIWGGLDDVPQRAGRAEQDSQPVMLPGRAGSPLPSCCRGPGLCLFVLTVTFMSVDWVMSLDPHWYSTIFGVWMLGGQGLSTLAFTIIVHRLAREVLSRCTQVVDGGQRSTTSAS